MGPVGTSPLYYSGSRPQSRAQSHQFSNGSQYHRGSIDDHVSPLRLRSPTSDMEDDSLDGDSFINSLSSLPMPRSPGDSDSDIEDSSLGLVMDRSSASSTISLDVQDRLDVLQRANAEMSKKLMEAEKTLQNKLEEHEMELEEMQSRLEEVRSELSATKREEKELRSKEVCAMDLLTEYQSCDDPCHSDKIPLKSPPWSLRLGNYRKVWKTLEPLIQVYRSSIRSSAVSPTFHLPKLLSLNIFPAESERYRNTLRRRDQEIKDFQESAALQTIENQKWTKEHDTYEERIIQLEMELSIAQQAQVQLDEQKQENLMLKETIDRMRFDMDELRSNIASAVVGGSSGTNSAVNTVSKSLGAELLGKMKSQWGMEDEMEDPVEGDDAGEVDIGDDLEGENTEGEDVIQTIITRKKRVSGMDRFHPVCAG